MRHGSLLRHSSIVPSLFHSLNKSSICQRARPTTIASATVNRSGGHLRYPDRPSSRRQPPLADRLTAPSPLVAQPLASLVRHRPGYPLGEQAAGQPFPEAKQDRQVERPFASLAHERHEVKSLPDRIKDDRADRHAGQPVRLLRGQRREHRQIEEAQIRQAQGVRHDGLILDRQQAIMGTRRPQVRPVEPSRDEVYPDAQFEPGLAALLVRATGELHRPFSG
jgi:hypothetical protein